MCLPPTLPSEKISLLNQITQNLRNLPNLVALVLGGSYASGFARPGSDLDVGLYYRQASPLSVDHVRSVAETICTVGSIPTVTAPYEWGPWVNGGAWIQTPAGKVDFLYRNLDQVQTVLRDGQQGVCSHHYDQQPPYGFRSIVYFGETSICVPLYDPEGEIARLKQSIANYPEPLRNRIVQDSLWNAEFSLSFCRGFTETADVYNVAGCLSRVAQFLVQALFALNREYFVSDKYANRLLDQFPLRPPDFTSRLAGGLSHLGSEPAQLGRFTELLSALWRETVDLTDGAYQPRFRL